MERKTMGTLMSALRKSKGMTQQDVADKLGISNKTVSKWERDDGYPDISMLPAIAEIYGVSVDELIKGEIVNEKRKNDFAPAEKGKKQIELLISSAYEKFKNMSVIALVLAILSVALAFLLMNILDDYLFVKTAALITFCVSLILSIVAIVLEWLAGSRLRFSLSGEDAEKCIDKTVSCLKNARNFIAAVVGVAIAGSVCSGAAGIFNTPIITAFAIGVAFGILFSLILFFAIGSRLAVGVDNEKAKAYASYSKKTALGLIIGTICIALVASGVVGLVYNITNKHTQKFDNEKAYNDYMDFAFGDMYPMLEKDEKSLTVTVVDTFNFSIMANVGVDASAPEGVVSSDCGEVLHPISDGDESYCFDTILYTFDTKENMDKFVSESCVDGDFLSACSYDMLFNSTHIYEHNDDTLSVKYCTAGHFNDIAGICAFFVLFACVAFCAIYIAVRRLERRGAN